MDKSFLTALIFIISPCLVALSQPIAPETSYDVTGSLQHRIFLDGKLFFAETNDFSVQVRGSTVKITAWGFTNKELVVPLKDYTFITDGKTSYHITTFDVSLESVAKSQTATGNQLRMFNAFVNVFTSACPPNITANMGPVWIATASGAFIQSQGSKGGYIYPEHFICPDWPDVGGAQLKTSWSVSSQPPYLPERLVEFADGTVFDVVNKFFERWKQKSFPSIYRNGYTNAVFEVSEWNNVSGLHIPRKFSLTSYLPQPNGNDSGQLQVQSTYDGFITTVTKTHLDTVNTLVELPAWSQIREYRYGTTEKKPFTYTSPTGALLTKNEVLELEKRR